MTEAQTKNVWRWVKALQSLQESSASSASEEASEFSLDVLGDENEEGKEGKQLSALLDVSDCIEKSPFDIIQEKMEASLLQFGQAAVEKVQLPSYDDMVKQIKELWEGEELVQDCYVVPSDAASTWDIKRRALRCTEELSSGQQPRIGETIIRLRFTGGAFEQEFHVLASTTLHSLRESLFCFNDCSSRGQDRKENFCFFLNNQFYCGTEYLKTNPSKFVNLASPIIAWAELTQNKSFTQVSAQGVCIGDLSDLALGDTFLFLHHGCCEHRVDVVSMHLWTDQDPVDEKLYPMLVYASRPKRVLCMACAKTWARYKCFGHRMLKNSDAALKLCHWCFGDTFYDADGNLLQQFALLKVFPYYMED